ncbi:hypothetical protein AVEN_224202-1 [Araneus ventricosus]|uniref:Uncharacterized protein n=1 Tax=Araneus ventricosus TaxID=182803 RepID=A0A4Y2EJ80_ARAVE|nr:hypothetical protein AVEN_224202-1 [Araneus ventricosus]
MADGIIHVGGRLQKSKFAFLQKHLILIPAKHHFVSLLIWSSHEKVFHDGVSETLMEIRKKSWLIRGKANCEELSQSVCFVQTIYTSSPGVQVTAPLPVARVEQPPQSSIVGIDFGGPLYTKNSDNTFYIVLFTCAVTRAMHLELVNLTTENISFGTSTIHCVSRSVFQNLVR